MSSKPTNSQKLIRALWLAFQASAPMGMGFLHAESAKKVDESVLAKSFHQEAKETNELYADYLVGRMMKTDFKVNDKGELSINNGREPRADYQSWCQVYPTNAALIAAVEESFA